MYSIILMTARVLVGILIMKTGADLVQGKYPFYHNSVQEPLLTGLFIILVGIHIIFSSTVNKD